MGQLSEPDGRGGPHVFVEDLTAPSLSTDDEHHLRRVLRVRDGDALTASDGNGAWRACVLTSDGVEITGDTVEVPRRTPELTVAVALVKGERPELVVQKLTELDIDRIAFFGAERSVVRLDDSKVARNRERLAGVARAAAMQCRRCWLPQITTLRDTAEAATLRGAARCERGAPPPTLQTPTLLVGPEGGWSDAERAIEIPAVGLADLQLRVETAAIAAGTLLAALRAGLVAEA